MATEHGAVVPQVDGIEDDSRPGWRPPLHADMPGTAMGSSALPDCMSSHPCEPDFWWDETSEAADDGDRLF